MSELFRSDIFFNQKGEIDENSKLNREE